MRILPPFFLLTLFFMSASSITVPVPTPSTTANATDFIRTNCDTTLYPELCYHSLAGYANAVQQDPARLARVAVGVSLSRAKRMALYVANLSRQEDYAANPRAASALHDCFTLLGDAVDQIRGSIKQMRGLTGSGEELRFQLSNVQTWMSAALTNEDTCVDGFEDVADGPVKLDVCNRTLKVKEFLRNSLAINKAMASSSSAALYSTKQTRNRRLLAHDFPEWVSAGDRKLLQSSGASTKADIVVAQDGSGNYKTISEALAAAAKQRSGTKRFVIYVKKGIYRENVEVKRSMKNLMFIGDGIDATIVTGNKNVQDGSTTFRSATFAATGDGFIARGMTFENTAGPQKHQAVALRSGSDFSVFYDCSFKGYQDTLYVYSQRQFYRDCDIYGTIDFIFGDAVSVIQNCNIYIRKPMSNQRNTVTAQGRTDPNENTGIIIHNSHVTAASGPSSYKSYLGRPWQKYSRTVFMKCTLDGSIDPAGWLPWSGNFALSTLYYGEYMNTGSGASTSGRVKWPGFHVITSATEAGKFSVGSFLAGDSWIPATGVPFTAGL
ncbi:hypothetical protein Pfo_023622 [Paulownia fortunei]|nr:hypothetical protein Pfo_023622 [Paulownia fortunei]